MTREELFDVTLKAKKVLTDNFFQGRACARIFDFSNGLVVTLPDRLDLPFFVMQNETILDTILSTGRSMEYSI